MDKMLQEHIICDCSKLILPYVFGNICQSIDDNEPFIRGLYGDEMTLNSVINGLRIPDDFFHYTHDFLLGACRGGVINDKLTEIFNKIQYYEIRPLLYGFSTHKLSTLDCLLQACYGNNITAFDLFFPTLVNEKNYRWVRKDGKEMEKQRNFNNY